MTFCHVLYFNLGRKVVTLVYSSVSVEIVHTLIPDKGKGENSPRKKCGVNPDPRVWHCGASSDWTLRTGAWDSQRGEA